MFERLKNAFTASVKPARALRPAEVVSEWASKQGLVLNGAPDSKSFTMSGDISGLPWKLERGRASRDYINGEELRARAELKLNENVSVLIMNRPLKETLEKRTYEAYTDTLQTTADLSMPEEMRWLSMYPEAGWDTLPPAFWKRYAVLAEKRDHAETWLNPKLASMLLEWPEPSPNERIPFVLMILRGKAYLRMQFTPVDMPTLQHAAEIFTQACSSGLSGLSSSTPASID